MVFYKRKALMVTPKHLWGDTLGFEQAPLVAIDTESSGLYPDDGARVSCVAAAWDGGSIAIPFDQGAVDKLQGTQATLFEADEPNADDTWDWFIECVKHKDLIFHNAEFDLTMLDAGTRHWSGEELHEQTVWDTMIAQRALEPLLSASLDSVGDFYRLGGKKGLDGVSEWLKRTKHGKRYDLVPWPIIEPYVRHDAELTHQVYKAQMRKLEHRPELKPVIEREIELMKTLFLIEKRGIGYDSAQSLQIADQLEQRTNKLEARMPFKCNITDAKRYFFEEQELAPTRRTTKGGASLDEEQVRDWAAESIQWASEYKQVKWARRAISMWYRGYPQKIGADGRLRCRYRQGHVTSGRLSVERVQLQAIPKADRIEEGVTEVRKLLQARDEHQLWSLDMSQAELRIAAKYARCQKMLDALSSGADFHGQACERVFGVGPDAPDWKLKRDIGKQLTFGSLFHIGGEGFQKLLAKKANIHLPLAECEHAVRTWRNTYPEFDIAYRKAGRVFEDRGWIKILPGTKFETRSYKQTRDLSHTGWNRVVQGSLGAWLRMWLPYVEKEWPDLLVLTVHDSIVLEIPEDLGSLWAGPEELVQAIAEQSSRVASNLFELPMPIDCERWA